LRGEYGLVQVALWRGVALPGRPRAGHVGAVPALLGPRVDQDELLRAQGSVVARVVEHRGIWPRRDDRGVGGTGGAPAAEGEVDQGLELVLEHARTRAPHRLAVRLAGDRDRLADARELPRILVEPHLVQDLAGLADRRRSAASPRSPGLRPADEAEETPGERIVAQHGVVDVGCFLEEWRQHLLAVVEQMGRVGAVLLDRALGARTVADPELTLGIARADE